MKNTYLIGRGAEEIAAEYLTENKIQVVDRNYRTRFGELDIIAKDGKSFVFVEVKAKNTSRYGKPYEMVTEKKKRKLRMTAKSYLQDERVDMNKTNWRIDVISIDYETGTIEWLKNAVEDR